MSAVLEAALRQASPRPREEGPQPVVCRPASPSVFAHPAKRIWVSTAASVFFHLAVLFLLGFTLVERASFGVEQGAGGIRGHAGNPELVAEIELVEPEPVVEEKPVLTEDAIPEEKPKPQPKPPEKKVEKKPEAIKSVVTRKAVAATGTGLGGAKAKTRASYLRNPSPPYPKAAKMAGYEGVVFVRIQIDSEGKPTEVSLARSCGYEILDQAALSGVKEWVFAPAKAAGVAVASVEIIPVRFDLK